MIENKKIKKFENKNVDTLKVFFFSSGNFGLKKRLIQTHFAAKIKTVMVSYISIAHYYYLFIYFIFLQEQVMDCEKKG